MTDQPPVFVFGSNLLGIHGRGAARFAFDNRGAIWGKGVGYYGNSYGIPTKATPRTTLPLDEIASFVDGFKEFAADHPEITFEVTRVGCGLAGYKDDQIAPMFRGAPEKCVLPDGWREIAEA